VEAVNKIRLWIVMCQLLVADAGGSIITVKNGLESMTQGPTFVCDEVKLSA
jgi:hypothetical protein